MEGWKDGRMEGCNGSGGWKERTEVKLREMSRLDQLKKWYK
jgi:hypothetical protein